MIILSEETKAQTLGSLLAHSFLLSQKQRQTTWTDLSFFLLFHFKKMWPAELQKSRWNSSF
jgi:hypothetical protein